MRVLNAKAKAAVAGLLTLAALLTGCEFEDTLVTPTPTPFQVERSQTPSPCAFDATSSDRLQLEEPQPGGYYTRHVPVNGWVLLEPGRTVDVLITSSGGGLLASSELQVREEAEGNRHRVESVMVMPLLAERQPACVSISGGGRRVQIPIFVGGANP